jgi:hypothetical protein
MSITSETPQARPLFRRLALVMAFVCFILAAVFGIAPAVEHKLMTAGLCLFVGFVMLTIAKTGFWPPRHRR